MNTATHTDPFTQIKEAEAKAEKAIEHGSQKLAEAISEAKMNKQEELQKYEEEVKASGVEKLRGIKATAQQNKDKSIDTAKAEANSLKNKADSNMNPAVEVIVNAFDNLINS